MNNGVNDSTNQTIPGVKVAMPDARPVDASTSDVGAAVSKAQSLVASPQPASNGVPTTAVAPVPVPVAAVTVAPVVSNSASQLAQTVPVQTAPVATTGQVAVSSATVVQQQAVSAPVQQMVQNTDDGSSGKKTKKKKEKKPKNKLARFYFFIIILLVGGCAYLWYYHEQEMIRMDIKCTPVSTTEGSKELDLNSTVVQDLYRKVKTTIREDLAQSELNDELKVYLAYRQIATSELYDSHCNMFQTAGIEPFTCEITSSFVPKAFKEELLQLELKKLFGEDTNIPNQNIQLGRSCIGGFQYIKERGEYVQGQCSSTGATLYRADKELVGAASTQSTIVLTEQVKYYGSEGLEVPANLVSGKYKYTFRLDVNYNYVYISKELVE